MQPQIIKTQKFKFWEKVILIPILFFVFSIIFLCVFFNLRLNTNPSIPVGIYQLQKKSPQKNDYVSFCPPTNSIFIMAIKRGYLQQGYCFNKTLPMMKKIIAVQGDTIHIGQNGIYVNNQIIKDSQPYKVDGNNQPLPQLTIKNYILKNNEFLMFGENNLRSFDSRYFGTIHEQQIIGVLKPIFIF